jgi:methanogenic corrinoid protein MtbC1
MQSLAASAPATLAALPVVTWADEHLGRRLAEAITSRCHALAETIVAQYQTLDAPSDARESKARRGDQQAEVVQLLLHLAESAAVSRPSLFSEHVAWVKIALFSRRESCEPLFSKLHVLREVLSQELPTELARHACQYVEAALDRLPVMPSTLPAFLDQDQPLSSLAGQYLGSLLRGDRRLAGELILNAVRDGTPVEDVYLHVFQRSQREIGRLWQVSRLTVAQEHYCTAATQSIMSQLCPYMLPMKKKGRRLVAACVGGELHEIGMRMVADVLEMQGWDAYYLGADTPASSVVQALMDRQADVLGISAATTLRARAVAGLINAVRGEPMCRRVKILVGGELFNRAPGLWQEVNADGCAADAAQAVAAAQRVLLG